MNTTRTRVIRPHFYQSSIVVGVRLGDWKFIFAAAAALFISAVVFKWQYKGFNLALPLFFGTSFIGAAFFNWVRKYHRPRWLEHQFAWLLRSFRRKSNDLERSSISSARRTAWLTDSEEFPEIKR